MSNAIAAVRSRRGRTFWLGALMVLIGGCDIDAAPSLEPTVVGDAPEVQLSNVRYQVDRRRNRVWLLTRDGVLVYDVAARDKILVSLPTWQWAGAPYSCPPDLALGPKGEAVITSDTLAALWRVDPETLAVTVHALVLDADTDKDVGFSGLLYSSRHAAFFAVSHGHGSRWKIDTLLRRAQKIPLSAPVPKACELTARAGVGRHKTSPLAGL